MQNAFLEKLLDSYELCWLSKKEKSLQDSSILQRFRSLAQKGLEIFQRDYFEDGHITGSALVVDQSMDSVLLTLHRKLNLWLQLGGHTDGAIEVHSAAMREALEESGLDRLSFVNYEDRFIKKDSFTIDYPIPFDLDIHWIPSRPGEEGHFHYDIRYLIVANRKDPIAISEESHDLRWFTLPEARLITKEASMHRQFDKLLMIKELLGRCID